MDEIPSPVITWDQQTGAIVCSECGTSPYMRVGEEFRTHGDGAIAHRLAHIQRDMDREMLGLDP